MKRLMVLGSIVTLVGTLGWSATTTTPNSEPNSGRVGPCRQIEQACGSAGFVKGEAKEGKGLWKDCVQPIMNGQAVNGVSVPSGAVAACQAERAKRHAKQQGGSSPNANSGH